MRHWSLLGSDMPEAASPPPRFPAFLTTQEVWQPEPGNQGYPFPLLVNHHSQHSGGSVEGGPGPTWSQQDEARVAQLLVNPQELLSYGAGGRLVLRAQLLTQGLHFTEQLLWVGSKLSPQPPGPQPGPPPRSILHWAGSG